MGVSRHWDDVAAIGVDNDCDITESTLDDGCGELAPLSAEVMLCVDEALMRPRLCSLFISMPILFASSSAHMTSAQLLTDRIIKVQHATQQKIYFGDILSNY